MNKSTIDHFQNRYRKSEEYLKWIIKGKPVPPPHIIKQNVVRTYGHRYSITTLIESGTYLGEMVDAQKDHFKKIISIELSNSFYDAAKKRFQYQKNIEILNGDSGKLINDLVANLNEPALFWLDGHYSGGETAKADMDTPILNELDAILKSNTDHVILIDDARLFQGTDDYPTLEALYKFIAEKNGNYIPTVKNDIIRLTKKTG